MSTLTTKLISAAGVQEVPRGESLFAIPGTYSWVCPDGVTYVSVVCVGAGGAGGTRTDGGGGSGEALVDLGTRIVFLLHPATATQLL